MSLSSRMRGAALLALTTGLLAAMTGSATAQDAASPGPSADLTELELLWEAGGPAPEHPGTMSMAIHPITGDIWVAVPHDNVYWIMSPDGEYKETWGETGSGPGQFRFEDPSQTTPVALGAIAFAPDGSFYVGDLGNFRVQHFDAERHYVGEWGSFGQGDGQFSQIWSIATDGKTVYVGDCSRYDIQAFDGGGTFLGAFGGADSFCEIAMGSDGLLRALTIEPSSGEQAYAIFGPGGEERSRVALDVLDEVGLMAGSLAVAPDGHAFISVWDPGQPDLPYVRLIELSPEGVARQFAPVGEDLLVSADGQALYVSRGIDALSERWDAIRKYALPAD
jgi:DNA-binding beta-propeller fold protein YncE